MSGQLDCCPGEPFMGDPQGLHTFDCPVYLRWAEAMDARNAALMARGRTTWLPPRVWTLPPEPDAEAVRDKDNILFNRTADPDRPWRGNGIDLTWPELLARGPLVESRRRGHKTQRREP
jgi:hypothetical protein